MPSCKMQGLPVRVANKLRSKSFDSFDLFRKTFWQGVANDAELASQFNAQNLADVAKGLAPVSRKDEHAGKRRQFEVHHVEHD